jgi:hypothetical protein
MELLLVPFNFSKKLFSNFGKHVKIFTFSGWRFEKSMFTNLRVKNAIMNETAQVGDFSLVEDY